MQRQVLFVQGAGKEVHATWDDKLATSLQQNLGTKYHVLYPRMPHEDDPTYASWSEALRRQFEKLNNGDFLVGHSMGAAILLHTLAEQLPSFLPKAICLISTPFIGNKGWLNDAIKTSDATLTGLAKRFRVIFYRGAQDEEVPRDHCQLYADIMPDAGMTLVDGADHQLGNDLSRVAHDITAIDQEEGK